MATRRTTTGLLQPGGVGDSIFSRFVNLLEIGGMWAMIARVHSSILQGIDAIGCEVEVDVSKGQTGELKLVGLAEAAVKESISRIQAALRNSGYRWPGPKVTVNLAPADVRGQEAAKRALTIAAAGPHDRPAGLGKDRVHGRYYVPRSYRTLSRP